MLTTLSLFVATMQLQSTFVPESVLAEFGLHIVRVTPYRIDTRGYGYQMVTCETGTGNWQVRVRGDASDRPMSTNIDFEEEFSTDSWINGSHSGVPLAELSVRSKSNVNSCFINTYGKFERISVRTSETKVLVGGQPVPANPNRDRNRDRRVCELLARHALASLASRRARNSGQRNVAGSTMPLYSTVGETMVPLQDWAAARNLTIAFDRELGSAAVVYNGTRRVFVLGSKSWKMGTAWQPSGEMTMRLGSKWLVPSEALP